MTARPQLPPLPPGRYAVPDPDRPDVVTLWWAPEGTLTAWPRGHRWAPLPPAPPAGLSYPQRCAWRERWYAAHYWPWKATVVRAIQLDPTAARERFDAVVPQGPRPPLHSPRQERAARRRQRDQRRKAGVQAAVELAAAGASTRQVAAALEVSPATAWRWVRAGQQPGASQAGS